MTRTENKHPLKLEYVQLLIAALVDLGLIIENIDVVMVVPPENLDNDIVTYAGVSGNLGHWGWSWENLRYVAFERTGLVRH